MTLRNPDKKATGRPWSFDRAEALETAMLLFWRHGYEGVSIAQLTGAMGVKPPSLYAAFGSKEQLYREALQHYANTMVDVSSLETAATAKEGVRQVFREIAKAYTRPGYPRGCMVGVGSLRCGDENQIVVEETAALRKLSLQSFAERLERAKSEGELRADTDPQILAAYFASVVDGLSVQARDGASQDQLLAIGEIALSAWPGADKAR
jgi:TetR/AcrR family transcriptional regulator, copper-responsive repressor